MIPADSIDGFESDDDIFDEMENNEEHILSTLSRVYPLHPIIAYFFQFISELGNCKYCT